MDRTREPDAGFAWPVHRWARGQTLSAVLTAAAQNGQELAAGDFVRWCRQVIDLLDQFAAVAGPDHPVGRAAASRSRRSAAAWSGSAAEAVPIVPDPVGCDVGASDACAPR